MWGKWEVTMMMGISRRRSGLESCEQLQTKMRTHPEPLRHQHDGDRKAADQVGHQILNNCGWSGWECSVRKLPPIVDHHPNTLVTLGPTDRPIDRSSTNHDQNTPTSPDRW